jgi:peptidoglycan/LPS O-acetylase OafA/YrhL
MALSRALSRRTLAERFDPRHNSLNFLRLAFATAVIVSHAKPIGGFGDDPSIAGQAVGTWAVMGFFAISGYLIAASRSHTRIPTFLARRVLRIYPGFLVCLVVVAFCFAPLSVLLGDGHYSLSSALNYVTHNLGLKVERDGIAGTLPNAPYGPAWDGSLWTLFYEFACYLILGALLSVPVLRRRQAVAATFVVSAAIGGYGATHTLPNLADRFFMLAPVFLAGSLLYLYADRVRIDWRLGVLALALAPVATELHAMQYLGAPLVAYACLWLGIVLPCDRIGRRNDFSYGIYIYAFPIQQLLVLLGVNDAGLAVYTLIGIVATLPLAAASWFAIERPALALKRKRLVLPAATTTPDVLTALSATPKQAN